MEKALIASCAIFALVACTTTPGPLNDPRQIWCDHNTPRRDATEETQRSELDDINSHNARGAAWCGWKP
jgi:hypothetical protein